MKIIAFVLILISTSFLYADEWPYDPICRRFNATSVTMKLDAALVPSVVMCKFGSRSYLDKDSLPSTSNTVETIAVRVYRTTDTFSLGEDCRFFGADLVLGTDQAGNHYPLCQFRDKSYMELRTILLGPHSHNNLEMNQALGLQ